MHDQGKFYSKTVLLVSKDLFWWALDKNLLVLHKEIVLKMKNVL